MEVLSLSAPPEKLCLTSPKQAIPSYCLLKLLTFSYHPQVVAVNKAMWGGVKKGTPKTFKNPIWVKGKMMKHEQNMWSPLGFSFWRHGQWPSMARWKSPGSLPLCRNEADGFAAGQGLSLDASWALPNLGGFCSGETCRGLEGQTSWCSFSIGGWWMVKTLWCCQVGSISPVRTWRCIVAPRPCCWGASSASELLGAGPK